ncbi:prolipoprotein diacylglyceryl transferase [bacterium]|nr:prolipoprotein diacylglyceryl transferase [bacterium]
MHPILFKIGNFAVYSYGMVIAFSIFLTSFLVLRHGRKEGLSEETLLNIIFLIIVSGLFGARLLHILVHFSYYFRHPLEVIAIRHGGMAVQGGVIFGLTAGILFLRRTNLPTLRVLDLLALYFPLGQAIGRLGCFLNGCCYGKETNFFLSVRFPFDNVSRHPTQIYYCLSNLFIFLVLFFLWKGKRKNGSILLIYFMLYSISRYGIDFFRGNLEPLFLSLYPTQVISFFIFLIAAAFFIFQIIRGNCHSDNIPG